MLQLALVGVQPLKLERQGDRRQVENRTVDGGSKPSFAAWELVPVISLERPDREQPRRDAETALGPELREAHL